MNKNIASQQLNAASQIMQSSEGMDLCLGLLDICGELINLVASNININEADTENVKDIASSITYVSTGLGNISNEVGGADCLKISSESVAKLSEAISEHKSLVDKEQKAKADLKVVDAAITALKPQVESLEKKFTDQTIFKETLERRLEEYSDENIKALEKVVDDLCAKVVTNATKHNELVSAQDEHNKKLGELEQKIASMPDEKTLVEEYDKIEAEYKRLLTAKNDCSEEKQLEIREEIAKIDTEANGLKAAMELLKTRRSELESAKTKIETEKGIFETDFIQKLEDSMNDLKNNMSSHMATLNEIKDNALKLRTSIDKCDAIRKNCSFMFDATKAPLKAIASASKTEYEKLVETYDISMSEHINNLVANIKNNLGEIDKIINECRKSAACDQETLNTKAFGKDKA